MERADDFVLCVELHAPAADRHGVFEGRIGGGEALADFTQLEEGWKEVIPDTGAGRDEDESRRKLERRADPLLLSKPSERELVRARAPLTEA